MVRLPTNGLIALVLVAACAGSDATVTETTTSAVTTSRPTVTTATSADQITTVATLVTTTGTASPTTTTPDGPSGSGCTPGDAVSLPEGEWYGVVVSASPSGIEFDLACWFTGEAAIAAAAEDGAEDPPNDYYVRNDNPQIRSLPVGAEAEVTWYPTGDPASEATVTFEEWVAGTISRGLLFGLWLDVIDGEVFRIREQWVP
jgi:hypothetical protein